MNTNKSLLVIVMFIISLFLVACKSGNTDNERKYISAVDSYAKNDIEGSLIIIDEILNADSRFYPALFLKGKCFFFLERTQDASAIFRKLVKKYPQFTDARLWFVRCLILNAEYDEARLFLNREMSFNQSDWRFYYLYSLLAERTGNLEERLVMLKNAGQQVGEGGKVYLDLARIWYALELNDRSLEYLNKAKSVLGDNAVLDDALKTLMAQIQIDKGVDNEE